MLHEYILPHPLLSQVKNQTCIACIAYRGKYNWGRAQCTCDTITLPCTASEVTRIVQVSSYTTVPLLIQRVCIPPKGICSAQRITERVRLEGIREE